MSWYWKQKPTWRKDLITYNGHPWIMFSFNWLVIISRGREGSSEIGRPKSRGWKNFGRSWTRGVGGISGTLQPLLACYILFRVVPFLQATTSQNVLTSKFTINQLHVDFITKDCKCCYKKGQVKVGQVLQIGAGIPKWDNFF